MRLQRFSVLLLSATLLPSSNAFALEAMDDMSLADVSGRDGITVNLQPGASGWSAAAIQMTLDADDTDWATHTGPREATLSINNFTLNGVNSDGSVAGAPSASGVFTLDVASNGTGPLLAMDLHTTSRLRLRTDSLTIPYPATTTGRSFGTFAYDFEGGLELVNRGVFSMDYGSTYFLGQINGSDLFYRQGDINNDWMALHDFDLMWEIPEGVLGISTEGIVHKSGNPWTAADISGGRAYAAPVESDLINLALDFEYIFGTAAGAEEFQITSDARGAMHFGWLGSVKDAELLWSPNGIWHGTIADANGGGTIFNPDYKGSELTDGLRLSVQWDYVSLNEAVTNLGDPSKEFRWRLGETADVATADLSRVNFELGDWTIWGERSAPKPAALYFPLIALDVIKGAGNGPGGLCWGYSLNGTSCGSASGYDAQYVNLEPGNVGSTYGASLASAGDAGAMAIVVRDGQLQAYSRKVRFLERDGAGAVTATEFDWGLIYALANIDANFYLYPGGSGNSISDGVIADIAVTSQTFAESNDASTSYDDTFAQGFNWDHGTHLMLADTTANMGIGFMSGSFALLANDTRIWVKSRVGDDYYTAGLDLFSPQARFAYTATFGGGLLPGHADYGVGAKPQTVRGLLLDLNLEGVANVRFSPSHPDSEVAGPNFVGARNFLGYSGAFRLQDTNIADFSGDTSGGVGDYGSYLSFAEPGRPDVVWRWANISGDLAFTNGMIDVRGSGEDGDGKPKLKISNNVLIGAAAAGRLTEAVAGTTNALQGIAAGQALEINRIMLGNGNLGRIVVPSAQIYASITLQPQ